MSKLLAEPVIGSNRRGITPAIRRAILGEDDDAFCVYCGQLGTEIDHIVPFSRGGGLDLENLAAACRYCNSEKYSYTVQEWADKRRDAGKPWPIPHVWDRLAELVYRTKLSMSEEDFEALAWRSSCVEDAFGSTEEMYKQLLRLRDVHTLPTSQRFPEHWIELVSSARNLKRLRDIWRRASELGDLTADLRAAAKVRSEELGE